MINMPGGKGGGRHCHSYQRYGQPFGEHLFLSHDERTPVIEDFDHIFAWEKFRRDLVDLKLPQKHKITVLLILRGETEEDMDVLEASPDIYVRQDDVLVVFGKRECINEYERKYGVHKNL